MKHICPHTESNCNHRSKLGICMDDMRARNDHEYAGDSDFECFGYEYQSGPGVAESSHGDVNHAGPGSNE